MAALTADRDTTEREFPCSMIHELTATAAVQFYKGGLVALDRSTGLLIKATEGAADDYVVGVSLEDKLTVSGDRLKFKSGCFKFANAGDVTVVMRDQRCYVTDDQTVAAAKGDDAIAGTIYDVDSDGVWVHCKYPLDAHSAADPSGIAVQRYMTVEVDYASSGDAFSLNASNPAGVAIADGGAGAFTLTVATAQEVKPAGYLVQRATPLTTGGQDLAVEIASHTATAVVVNTIAKQSGDDDYDNVAPTDGDKFFITLAVTF